MEAFLATHGTIGVAPKFSEPTNATIGAQYLFLANHCISALEAGSAAEKLHAISTIVSLEHHSTIVFYTLFVVSYA